MDAQRIDTYIIANQKYFPAEKMSYLKDRLVTADDSRLSVLSSVELKDPTTLLLVSIFLGSLGIDRFMIGDIGMGVLKLLTAGLCGILTIVDWFMISNKVKELNYNNVMQVL